MSENSYVDKAAAVEDALNFKDGRRNNDFVAESTFTNAAPRSEWACAITDLTFAFVVASII